MTLEGLAGRDNRGSAGDGGSCPLFFSVVSSVPTSDDSLSFKRVVMDLS